MLWHCKLDGFADRSNNTATEGSKSMYDDDEVDLSQAQLFADSNRGVYIPQHFAETVRREYVRNISPEQFAILLHGPDDEFYWSVWAEVLDNAKLVASKGREWFLYQDGDLWLVPVNNQEKG